MHRTYGLPPRAKLSVCCDHFDDQARRALGGVLIAARKTVDAPLPCQDSEGIVGDPRCIWLRIRIKGWGDPILMASCYCKGGLGLKDQNAERLRSLAEASDQGRRCVLGCGFWNITPEELEPSCILDGLCL